MGKAMADMSFLKLPKHRSSSLQNVLPFLASAGNVGAGVIIMYGLINTAVGSLTRFNTPATSLVATRPTTQRRRGVTPGRGTMRGCWPVFLKREHAQFSRSLKPHYG